MCSGAAGPSSGALRPANASAGDPTAQPDRATTTTTSAPIPPRHHPTDIPVIARARYYREAEPRDGGLARRPYTGRRAACRRRYCVKTALAIVQVIIGIVVILGILLQTPKATGLGGTIGGGGDAGGGYRRRRGLEASLLRFSAVMIALFVVVSILSTYVTK